jgi:carbon-monoxide dehydrogenase large subunit
VRFAGEGVYTNTTQVDAYRGAGRPEAIYALERMMDRAARELGVDPWELRRRNFIPRSKFPYKTASRRAYDVGDFGRVLDRRRRRGRPAGFAARKAASEARASCAGSGLCYYIESILGDPSKPRQGRIHEDGTGQHLCRHPVERAGARDGLCPVPADQTGIPVDARSA